jgi:hypothetical protein
MGYSKGIVCFIDVLGSKDRIREFDKLFEISDIFHKELSDLKKLVEFDCENRQMMPMPGFSYSIFPG